MLRVSHTFNGHKTYEWHLPRATHRQQQYQLDFNVDSPIDQVRELHTAESLYTISYNPPCLVITEPAMITQNTPYFHLLRFHHFFIQATNNIPLENYISAARSSKGGRQSFDR